MGASVASLLRKSISILCAAVLTVGLVPAAAFAVEEGDAVAPQNSESANADSDIQAEAEHPPTGTTPKEVKGRTILPSMSFRAEPAELAESRNPVLLCGLAGWRGKYLVGA